MSLDFFAPTAKGMEELLATELRGLGAATAAPARAGVAFAGPLTLAYRACLWSRLASRVLLRLAVLPAPDTDVLYEGVRGVDWATHLSPDGTLAVNVTATDAAVGHTHFAALRVKDAVVDQLRERTGRRPSVDLIDPDVRLNVHLRGAEAVLSLDLSGESLHRRHYRRPGPQVQAPLKEQLAAAILIRAGWPAIAAAGGALVDPLCGSGTLPIEAALMAGDVAPGLLRERFGFLRWGGHDAAAWRDLLEEAANRRTAGYERIPPVVGYDADPSAVRLARENVARAGLEGHVLIEQRDIETLAPPPADETNAPAARPAGPHTADGRPTGGAAVPGLVVANPPYGERLGSVPELRRLYAELGARLREHFPGWQAGIFTANEELAHSLGLRARRLYTLYNGALRCRLLLFDLGPDFSGRPVNRGPAAEETAPPAARIGGDSAAPAPAQDFANRLRKNLRTLGRWARREGVTCYRLYDADLPEYAVAVDIYEQWVHVQEYTPPLTVDPRRAGERLRAALEVIPAVLEVSPDHVFLKVRSRQRGLSQYERHADTGVFHEVGEAGLRFLVNFTDYLDTGLFLDHRPIRALVREQARGRDVLNLFGYTGTATVYAAAGGARSTVTVDLSRTYLDWTRRNLELNGLAGPRHRLVRADVVDWLRSPPPGDRRRERGGGALPERYGLIFLDPPTFSSSKAMETTLDVQRDHVALITHAAELLTPDGLLLFSTNRRRFRLDEEALDHLVAEDITKQTIPPDFARHPRIHHCWRIMHPGPGRPDSGGPGAGIKKHGRTARGPDR